MTPSDTFLQAYHSQQSRDGYYPQIVFLIDSLRPKLTRICTIPPMQSRHDFVTICRFRFLATNAPYLTKTLVASLFFRFRYYSTYTSPSLSKNFLMIFL